jgi:methylase of polypeptide subunit release factors
LIRRLLAEVPEKLEPGGLLLMEIEATQGPHVLSLAYDVFAEAEIHLHQDFSGRDRLLEVLV